MGKVITLNFQGPFTIKSLGNYDCGSKRDIEGIYLWTVRQANSYDYLIHYIGESTKLIRRQSEHLTEVLGLNYGIFDPELITQGELVKLWEGMWRDKSKSRIANCLSAYPEITKKVIEYLDKIEIFIAETELESNLRRHCEAIIGNNLRKNHPENKSIYPDDNRVILRKNMDEVKLIIKCEKRILGIDREVTYNSKRK